MSTDKWLLLTDTDKVQRYIFSTNRLKEIRGASQLLEKLNTQHPLGLPSIKEFNGEPIFTRGGGILATFPTEPDAQRYLLAVKTAYQNQTRIASTTGVIVRLSDNEQESLRHAHLQLRLEKEQPRNVQPTLASSYFRLCQSCNRYPITNRIDDNEAICTACYAKREEDNKKPFPAYSAYTRFAEKMGECDSSWLNLTELPDKLDELEGSNTQHVGFIHADINNLGRFLGQKTSLKEVGELGKTIEETVKDALVTAIRQVGLKPSLSENRWPFLIIILGGDDVSLIVPAKQAVPLANALCLAFEEHIKKTLGETTNDFGESVGQLAMSAGVAIAKPKYPAYALSDMADDLTKNAKRLSHELQESGYGAVPTLDFHVIQTPTTKEIDAVRKEAYVAKRNTGEYWYTSRPLPCQSRPNQPGVDALLKTIRTLRRNQFPHNKLAQWKDLIYTDEIEQILGWQILQTRVTSTAREALVEAIATLNLSEKNLFTQSKASPPQYKTPLLDIVELYEFVAPEERDDA